MVGSGIASRGRATGALCTLAALLIGLPTTCLAYSSAFPLYAGWNLWSLTLIPIDPDPQTVFEGMPLDQRLYRWDVQAQEYVPYRDDDPARFGPLVMGQGYWVFSDHYRDMSYDYIGPPDHPWLDLPHSGWHLLGSPVRTYRVPQMTVADMATSASVPIDEAGALGWLDPVLWGFPSHSYRLLYLWDSGQGAWLLTHQPALRLELPAAPGW